VSSKTVYVVQNIEWGAVGVYSNRKAAWEHGLSICPGNKTGSYKELCEDDGTTLTNDDMDEVEIVSLPYLVRFEPPIEKVEK